MTFSASSLLSMGTPNAAVPLMGADETTLPSTRKYSSGEADTIQAPGIACRRGDHDARRVPGGVASRQDVRQGDGIGARRLREQRCAEHPAQVDLIHVALADVGPDRLDSSQVPRLVQRRLPRRLLGSAPRALDLPRFPHAGAAFDIGEPPGVDPSLERRDHHPEAARGQPLGVQRHVNVLHGHSTRELP